VIPLGVVDDELLLAGAVLGVVRREAHPLVLQRVDGVEDDVVGAAHPVGGETGAVVERLHAAVLALAGVVVLRLVGDPRRVAVGGEFAEVAPQLCPGAGRPGLAVEVVEVGEQ
jgi:hypothetical protein